MPKYKATAYIRLSYTDDHSSESDSVSNQRKLIENFVERNPDIEVVSEKIDDGYSGIIFDRPAFKEMMQDVTDGNINCVIVKDLSRLGREYIETGRYLRRVFPAYGVRFIAITDSIDTAHDSGDDLTVSVKNIMNEAYCRDISIKTRSSLDVKRRNGDFVGAFPVYGYMKAEDNKNLLVPDPYAARVVCPTRKRATRTKPTASGQQPPSSASCRTKPIPERWCRANRVRRITRSSRWSSAPPPSGCASRMPIKR